MIAIVLTSLLAIINAVAARPQARPPTPQAHDRARVRAADGPAIAHAGTSGRWTQLTFSKTANLQAIVPDPNGKYVWVSDKANRDLIRIGMDLSTTTIPLLLGSRSQPFTPGYFAFAPNGSIYIGGCLSKDCAQIGVLSSDLQHFTTLVTPQGDGPGIGNQLVTAQDGTIWFVTTKHLGKIDQTGTITEYNVPFPRSGPNLVVAQDGFIWYSGFGSGSTNPTVARFDPSTGRVKWTTLRGPEYGVLRLSGGMSLDRSGRIAVIGQLVPSDEGIFLDLFDARLHPSVVRVGEAYGPQAASMIEGPDQDLWWGTPFCPRRRSPSGDRGCTMAKYDPKSGRKIDVHYGRPSGEAGNLAVGGDGNVWGLYQASYNIWNAVIIDHVDASGAAPARRAVR